jgi:general secretion pathway protein A
MYRSFFGLVKAPFSMTADPDSMMQTAQHREALGGLTYSILARRGIAVMTGDVGTGKTTILGKVLRFLEAREVTTSVILNPTLNTTEFLEAVMLGFGLQPDRSKTQCLRTLEEFLVKKYEEGKSATLFVDEAHSLPRPLLEEIRLLGNIERGDAKLLQILLLGQNELDEMLNREDFRQLKQRIALRFSIGPLMEREVEPYIRHRWSYAGGTLPPPFTPSAIEGVRRWSRGFPRLINAICDNALLLAFAEESKSVTDAHVHAAAEDLQLQAKTAAPAPIASATTVSTTAVPAAVMPTATIPATKVPATVAVSAAGTAPESKPAIGEIALAPGSFRTLERYTNGSEPRSFLTRCAGWLGFAHTNSNA